MSDIDIHISQDNGTTNFTLDIIDFLVLLHAGIKKETGVFEKLLASVQEFTKREELIHEENSSQ